MARRPDRDDPETLRSELVELLTDFEASLRNEDLRNKVLTLVKAFHKLRDLGSSLVPLPAEISNAARDRILLYFRSYPGVIIHSDELLVVSGIQEYARRIRELRVQFGWPIISGLTAKEMVEENEFDVSDVDQLKPNTYILLKDEQDRDAAHRWNLANSIRRESGGVKSKLLKFFRKNVGLPVTGEELKYIAQSAANWPRRIRELRREEGWPIKTRNTGRPDLATGTYILEEDRQSEVHDRNIPDVTQILVLKRDEYECVRCSWSYEDKKAGDPRHMLELHHIQHHVKGGENTLENLATLCNVCHDEVHRMDRNNEWSIKGFRQWVQTGINNDTF